tara:strand:+ start:2406 stop:2603 length:198 start_codon:yes stop_codon:yes gene_type:complete
MTDKETGLFKGKGFYTPDHTPIAIMPDNQVNDDWHYKLQEVIHENTFCCWHEDEQDFGDCQQHNS